MSILIIAEHDNQTLHSNILPTVTAAQAIATDIHVLIAGDNAGHVAAAAAKISGVSKVLHADGASLGERLAENLGALVSTLAREYQHILTPASFFGKNILPRIAGVLEAVQISDITAVDTPDTFRRPIYAGNAFETVQALPNDKPLLISVRPTAFDPAGAEGGSAEIVSITAPEDTGLTRFVSRELTKSDRPDLGSADVVVSGGRGVGSGENFESVIVPLADKLNAAIGASRAAVDAGFIPNDHQVGQTGKIVAPQLYIAVGISGAIQHLAGMKDSKVIVAINKDPDAPIFNIADYGLVADLFEAVPELVDKL